MNARAHYVALAAVAVAVGAAFLQEPGFGDDLTYWSFAFDLHERGLAAWSEHSFHQLRWPVWGWCWLWQAVVGPGLLSYYAVPLLYLAAGALLAFSLGHRLTGSVKAGWACAFAFLLHPLIDTVCYRPMPDLSEGILGAAAILSWWNLMQAEFRARAWVFAAATGVCVFVLEANRVTGVFIVPVLVLCTVLFFRRRFLWLLLAGAVAALLYAGECLFYQQLFGDWLHDLHANSRNTGSKGTEAVAVWELPFRFLDVFWSDWLAFFYFAFALVGIFAAWRQCGLFGRAVVLWFAVLYLEYACAPQSVFPVRPLLRDAERFLASLAIPGAVLAFLGLRWVLRLIHRLQPILERGRIVQAVAAVVVVIVLSEREHFDAGYVPELRTYLASVADGTRVFTHKAMRHLAFLVDARSARRLHFDAPERILEGDPQLEALAAGAQEFWYVRKLVWLTARKRLESKGPPPNFASYFATPEQEWRLAAALTKDESPEFAFYRRRAVNAAPPEVVEWPTFPSYNKNAAPPRMVDAWNVPEQLRGRLLRLDIEAASDEVEGATARLTWRRPDGTAIGTLVLEPYLSESGSRDFFAGAIPAEAVRCEMVLKFARRTQHFTVTQLRALIEPR